MTAQDLDASATHGSLEALDAPVRTLFERIAGPAARPTPDLAAIGRALTELTADMDELAHWVDRLGDESGGLRIHAPERGPRLSIVHRRTGQMGPIHDHATWIVLATIVGLETHRRYRVEGLGRAARLELAEERSLGPSDLVTMLPPDDLHSHGHLLGHGRAAYILILAGDDQVQFARNEWDLATGRHRILLPGDRGRWLDSEPMP